MIKKLRLLLVDDHPVVRAGLKTCLSLQPHFEVAGEASDGPQALALARELAPDVVLMDIRLPGMSGIEATRRLRAEVPATRVLVLTMYYNKQLIMEVMKSGAHGYVLKDAPLSVLVEAIEALHRGELYFSQEAHWMLTTHFNKPDKGDPNRQRELSWREREVLALLADSLSSKDIAGRLGVSVRTVQTHREHIMRKLDIHTATGLTRYALREGIVLPE